MKLLSTDINYTDFFFVHKKVQTYVEEQFDCQLCTRSFSSSNAVSQHVEGNKHQMSLRSKLRDCSVPLKERHRVMWYFVRKAEADMWNQVRIKIEPSGKYFCCLCEVEMSCPYNVVEHVEGQRHEEQLDLKRMFAQLNSHDWDERVEAMWYIVRHYDGESEDNIEESDDDDGWFYCNVCTKDLNSPKQVVGHVLGRTHQDNAE